MISKRAPRADVRGGMVGPRHQAGLTFIGFVIVAVLVAMAVLVGFKLAPAYIEYYSLKNALTNVVNDPELKDAQVREIRNAFSRRATVSSVTVVTPNDIEVVKDGNSLSLSTAYSVKVHLVGNLSACLDFEASAQR